VLVYLDPQNTDTVADLVLGQPNFITSKCNIDFVVYKVVSASTLCYPFGVVVDAVGNVYVTDVGNNRVLVYLDPQNTDTVADLVLGQPNFTSRTANNGGVSASSLHAPHGVAVDIAGNVHVADLLNNRVLEYHTPLTTDTVADVVLGQPNFISNTANNGGVSASSLDGPREVAGDAAGNVYVADVGNNRVLVYLDPQNTDTVADLVLGKPNFFTSKKCKIGLVDGKIVAAVGSSSASTLCYPFGVVVDAAGNVYVADGNNRVLEYHTPLTTDTIADVVLGQPNFTSNAANNGGVSASSLHGPHGVAVDTAGNVYVADLYNNRVLVYDGFLDLTPMPTCAGYDDPCATPLALKKKPNDQFH
jgi:streptogramin lyase